MFVLVVTVCLSGVTPEICADRLLPSPVPQAKAQCEASAAEKVSAWGAAHPSLVTSTPRCLPLEQAGMPLSLIEVAPGVYVHEGGIGIPSPKNRGDLANLGVVIGDDAVAVIDAGGSRAVGEAFYLAIRALTDKPISAVILTHMHPDHTLGAAVFVEAGATLIGHPKLNRGLRSRAENYEASLETLIGREGFLGTKAVFPADTASQPSEIDLGGRVLDLQVWPTAHTDNDLTVLDRVTGTLFAGDLVFDTHTPALDGSLLGWRAVLERLGPKAERVVPGHGGPVLDWPEGGKPLRGYLNALTEETRAAIKKGESLGEAVDHIATGQAHKWALFQEFNIRNATAAYKELEWE